MQQVRLSRAIVLSRRIDSRVGHARDKVVQLDAVQSQIDMLDAAMIELQSGRRLRISKANRARHDKANLRRARLGLIGNSQRLGDGIPIDVPHASIDCDAIVRVWPGIKRHRIAIIPVAVIGDRRFGGRWLDAHLAIQRVDIHGRCEVERQPVRVGILLAIPRLCVNNSRRADRPVLPAWRARTAFQPQFRQHVAIKPGLIRHVQLESLGQIRESQAVVRPFKTARDVWMVAVRQRFKAEGALDKLLRKPLIKANLNARVEDQVVREDWRIDGDNCGRRRLESPGCSGAHDRAINRGQVGGNGHSVFRIAIQRLRRPEDINGAVDPFAKSSDRGRQSQRLRQIVPVRRQSKRNDRRVKCHADGGIHRRKRAARQRKRIRDS